MLFQNTKFAGVFIIEPKKNSDERGFFARTWCQQEFTAHNLNSNLAQSSISFNAKKGTLRGMHYQADPFPEAKLVRCTMGSIYDVVIDLRPDSPTFKQWLSVELSAENRHSLYIPTKFAHGFQTLSNDAEVFYMISEFYHPECSRGIRWDDPFFAIDWPLTDPIVSDRDKSFPGFRKENI